MTNNFNETSMNIFKIFELNSKFGQRTSLGLLSLMIELNHGKEHENQYENNTQKDGGMEF